MQIKVSTSLIAIILAVAATAAPIAAQDSSLLHRAPVAAQSGLPREHISFIYRKPIPPPTLELHDIVTVVVSIRSSVLSEGEVEHRKRVQHLAILADWLRLDGLSLKPAPQNDGDPIVDYQQNNQFRAEAELETRNFVDFTIAAEVVDIRPNGNLVIEARQQFRNNEELWERALTGEIRREDVAPDNKVESEDIANLRICKREVGQVRDGYRRGWLQKFYDWVQPF